jgi:hypothetical protein
MFTVLCFSNTVVTGFKKNRTLTMLNRDWARGKSKERTWFIQLMMCNPVHKIHRGKNFTYWKMKTESRKVLNYQKISEPVYQKSICINKNYYWWYYRSVNWSDGNFQRNNVHQLVN